MKTAREISNSLEPFIDEMLGKEGTEEREKSMLEAQLYVFGQVLMDARESQHLTQTELAEKVGMDKTYISRIENGKVEPKISTVMKIINALGLSMDVLNPVQLAF